MAANGEMPTTGPATMAAVMTDGNEELALLFARATRRLVSVAGTNTITASSTPALTAYSDDIVVAIQPANDGTGSLTLNIDGVGAKALRHANGSEFAAGEWLASTVYIARYLSDGSGEFRVFDALSATQPTLQLFTSGGTYTKPSGVAYLEVFCVGPGGDGGDDNAAGTGGAGGGGGAYAYKLLSHSAVGATETVTVGTGGSGTSTSFGTLCVADAGNDPGTHPAAGTGGAVANCTGDILLPGQDGETAVIGTTTGFYGGRGAGPLGGPGGYGTSGDGVDYGGGGGGADDGAGAPGSGADGVVLVKEFYR